MIQLRNINAITPRQMQQLANNYAVAKNLRDFFPFPYTEQDACDFIDMASKGLMGQVFSVEMEGTFIGVGSLIPQKHEHRINAETGYWIGEPYWGNGYATTVVKLLTQHAFEKLDLLRLYAYVYSYNAASMRVLEKAGFHKEAIIRSSVIKHDKIYDEYLYSMIKL